MHPMTFYSLYAITRCRNDIRVLLTASHVVNNTTRCAASTKLNLNQQVKTRY